MKLLFKNPSIKLVGVYDGRQKSWECSRPHATETLEQIQELNLPVNGFMYFQFEIESSLLLRDLIFMIRPTNNWARSFRTTYVTADNLYYSSEYRSFLNEEIKNKNSRAYELHCKSVDENVPQDIRKNDFMYAVSTKYSLGITARTLSDLIYSLKQTVLNVYGQLFENEVYHTFRAIKELNTSKLPPHNNFNIFNSMKIGVSVNDENLLNHNNVLIKPLKEFGIVIITAVTSGSLASQLERQENGFVRSSLVNNLLEAKSIKDLILSQHDDIVTTLVVPWDYAIKIAKTRSCWFAQFDKASKISWSNIVVELAKAMKLTPYELLICKGSYKECPWFNDQLAKLKAGNPNGKEGEVNFPCPVITGIPELYQLRGKKFNSDSELFKLWGNLIKDLIRNGLYLTDYGKEFLDNVFKYGYAEKSDNDRLKDITEELYKKYVNLIGLINNE